MTLDHTKKYFKIGKHLVEMSFADEPNTELFARISSILFGCNPHICNKEQKTNPSHFETGWFFVFTD